MTNKDIFSNQGNINLNAGTEKPGTAEVNKHPNQSFRKQKPRQHVTLVLLATLWTLFTVQLCLCLCATYFSLSRCVRNTQAAALSSVMQWHGNRTQNTVL